MENNIEICTRCEHLPKSHEKVDLVMSSDKEKVTSVLKCNVEGCECIIL